MRFSCILLFISWTAFGQIQTPWIETPPNGIKLNDSVYLDATEIANIHWLEYEYHVRTDSPDSYYKSILPNEEQLKAYRPEYLRHPTYRYHPVVGITRKQAIQFCKWRTSMVNLKLEEQGANYRVQYRLPTEGEWEVAARSLDTLAKSTNLHPYVFRSLKKGNKEEVAGLFPDKDIDFKDLRKQCKLYNRMDRIPFVLALDFPWFIIFEERLPQETTCGLYPIYSEYIHLIGNVAEMVEEPGIVKGGSWKHRLAVSFPTKRIYIDPKKAYDWVGFRCAADIIPIKP